MPTRINPPIEVFSNANMAVEMHSQSTGCWATLKIREDDKSFATLQDWADFIKSLIDIHGPDTGLYHTSDCGDDYLNLILKPKKRPKIMFDAKFHAFQEVGKLLDEVLPNGYQFTREQSDAIHKFAEKLAEDLLGGEYELSQGRSDKA
jgi:hypothetical protein